MKNMQFIFLILLFPALALSQTYTSAPSTARQAPVNTYTLTKKDKTPHKKITTLYIGHNLTPSTDVPKANTFTVGNYAVGFAVTDGLLIATSPWIWTTYNTKNLHLKWGHAVSPRSTVGLQASYFDSYDSAPLLNSPGSLPVNAPFPGSSFVAAPAATGTTLSQNLNRYQWTSYSVNGLYSYKYGDEITQYVNLKYSYFVNDEMPYSLRMDPGNDNIRDQWDLSTLVRVPMNQSKASVALELGALGLNYEKTYAHVGASVAYSGDAWLVQIGASYTAQLAELGKDTALEVGRFDNRTHYSETAGQYYTERYLQVAVHPEIQIQYIF